MPRSALTPLLVSVLVSVTNAAVRPEKRRRCGTRAWYLAASIALASALLTANASAQDRSPPQAASSGQSQDEPVPHPLERWLDTQAFTVSTRYNYIEDALDRTVQNRLQTQVQIEGAFRFDAAGRYRMHAGLKTGDSFTSGWNPTGIGTGEGTAKIYLKQLFVSAEPWNGIEAEYGSLHPERGHSTEITTYDNDGYVTAGRLNVRRPREVFFDDITVSVGYIGYVDTAFVLDRTGAFSRQNYWQVLVSKRVLRNLELSTDYSELEDDGILRQGARWRVDHRFVEIVSTNPARMFGLWPRKGTIAVGSDGDLVLWDPDRAVTLSASTHHMRVDYNPYEGRVVHGAPAMVLSRGDVIVDNGTFTGARGRGQFVKRQAGPPLVA